MAESNAATRAGRLSAVKGMNDILPPDSAQWEALEGKVREVMRRYAFENVRTPIVEPTALFVRGLGAVTDIVEKEMYSFVDQLNGEHLTLRPENTAGVIRAVLEHSLAYAGGRRLYYMGPMFRHERPQRGRYRQFHQIGAEAIGFAGAELDAELILVAHGLWQQLGLEDVELQLNSLGQPHERAAHRSALIQHFEQHSDSLDDEARRRLPLNPLRLLDSKNPAMQPVIEQAPRLLDFLGPQSQRHFELVRSILDANGVPYAINARLVRGLDYYNLTVFEFVTNRLGAQGTICAGGRYDYLAEQLGGKPLAAVGWAMGIERVLELIRGQGVILSAATLDAYAIVADESSLPTVMACLQVLRSQGVSVQMHAGADSGAASFKAQFKRADASGARFALIFGSDEMDQGAVSIKDLRLGAGEQRRCLLAQAAQWAKSLQSTA
jgi:histidyl-tRNA synthetase